MSVLAYLIYFISTFLKMFTIAMVFVSSLLVALTWQFAQFVFLLQGFALFGLQVMSIASTREVHMYNHIIPYGYCTYTCIHCIYICIYICM